VDFVQRNKRSARHLTGLGLVVALHVLVVYALVNGLARKAVEVINQPLLTTIIKDVTVREEAPAPPPLELEPPPPAYVPPPEIRIEVPAVNNTITAVTNEKPPEAAAPPPPEPITPPRFDAAYLDNPPPTYPALARRRGYEGKVVLRVLIRTDGTPETINIVTSSGYRVLDEAALDAVRRWRFIPAQRGTEPVVAWVDVPLTFKLK